MHIGPRDYHRIPTAVVYKNSACTKTSKWEKYSQALWPAYALNSPNHA